jgi:RNA polymerase sigma-70 factor (ECF subfamily)
VATQDRAAFGQLFDRFGGQIYAYLYARCGQRADAEDLTEQVFLHAWQAIGRYRWQGRPFVAWLYRLAHNAHIDLVRRGRPLASLETVAELPQLASPAGEGDLGTPVGAEALAQAVRHLTPKQQQVLHLRFTADLDTGEIAALMGEREGAIRALQMRALQRLRRLLTQGTA